MTVGGEGRGGSGPAAVAAAGQRGPTARRVVKPGLAHRWMSATTCPERASAARECSLLALLGARDGWRGWRARVATTEGSEPRRALERGARDGCRVALHQSAGASERRPPGGGPEASGLRSARCGRVLSGSAASGPQHDTAEGNGVHHALATACVVTTLPTGVCGSGWLHESGRRRCRASALAQRRRRRSPQAAGSARG